jgi:hypothetical protein
MGMLHALRFCAAVALLVLAPAVATARPHQGHDPVRRPPTADRVSYASLWPPDSYRQVHGRLAVPPMGARVSWQYRLPRYLTDPRPIKYQRYNARHRHHARHHRKTRHALRVVPLPKPRPVIEAPAIDVEEQGFRDAWRAVPVLGLFARFLDFLAHRPEAPTDYLPVVLRQKLGEIQRACTGFKVISTVCGRDAHSRYVAGTRRVSLHCLNRAADFRVENYRCAYAQLKGWKGGMSLDPAAVHHIHLSVGGREGRFYHHGHRHYAHRYRARRHA